MTATEHFDAIRRMYPTAPRPGARVEVYIGQRRAEGGRQVATVVRGPDDPPRIANLIGYSIRLRRGRYGRRKHRVEVLAEVKLPRGESIFHDAETFDVHVSCLAAIPSRLR